MKRLKTPADLSVAAKGNAMDKEDSIQKSFPWFNQFMSLFTENIGSKNLKILEALIAVFTKKVAPCVDSCYTRPNRALKMRKIFTKVLFLFHVYYQDLAGSDSDLTYKELMTELLAMYLDIEIKASRKGPFSLKKTGQIMSTALHTYLLNSEHHILDAILKAKLITKENGELCAPIVGKVLKDATIICCNAESFARYMLAFKLWKRITSAESEKKKIAKAAVGKLTPSPEVTQEIRSITPMILPCLPTLTPSPTIYYYNNNFNYIQCKLEFLKMYRPVMPLTPLAKEFDKKLKVSEPQKTFLSCSAEDNRTYIDEMLAALAKEEKLKAEKRNKEQTAANNKDDDDDDDVEIIEDEVQVIEVINVDSESDDDEPVKIVEVQSKTRTAVSVREKNKVVSVPENKVVNVQEKKRMVSLPEKNRLVFVPEKTKTNTAGAAQQPAVAAATAASVPATTPITPRLSTDNGIIPDSTETAESLIGELERVTINKSKELDSPKHQVHEISNSVSWDARSERSLSETPELPSATAPRIELHKTSDKSLVQPVVDKESSTSGQKSRLGSNYSSSTSSKLEKKVEERKNTGPFRVPDKYLVTYSDSETEDCYNTDNEQQKMSEKENQTEQVYRLDKDKDDDSKQIKDKHHRSTSPASNYCTSASPESDKIVEHWVRSSRHHRQHASKKDGCTSPLPQHSDLSPVQHRKKHESSNKTISEPPSRSKSPVHNRKRLESTSSSASEPLTAPLLPAADKEDNMKQGRDNDSTDDKIKSNCEKGCACCGNKLVKIDERHHERRSSSHSSDRKLKSYSYSHSKDRDKTSVDKLPHRERDKESERKQKSSSSSSRHSDERSKQHSTSSSSHNKHKHSSSSTKDKTDSCKDKHSHHSKSKHSSDSKSKPNLVLTTTSAYKDDFEVSTVCKTSKENKITDDRLTQISVSENLKSKLSDKLNSDSKHKSRTELKTEVKESSTKTDKKESKHLDKSKSSSSSSKDKTVHKSSTDDRRKSCDKQKDKENGVSVKDSRSKDSHYKKSSSSSLSKKDKYKDKERDRDKEKKSTTVENKKQTECHVLQVQQVVVENIVLSNPTQQQQQHSELTNIDDNIKLIQETLEQTSVDDNKVQNNEELSTNIEQNVTDVVEDETKISDDTCVYKVNKETISEISKAVDEIINETKSSEEDEGPPRLSPQIPNTTSVIQLVHSNQKQVSELKRTKSCESELVPAQPEKKTCRSFSDVGVDPPTPVKTPVELTLPLNTKSVKTVQFENLTKSYRVVKSHVLKDSSDVVPKTDRRNSVEDVSGKQQQPEALDYSNKTLNLPEPQPEPVPCFITSEDDLLEVGLEELVCETYQQDPCDVAELTDNEEQFDSRTMEPLNVFKQHLLSYSHFKQPHPVVETFTPASAPVLNKDYVNIRSATCDHLTCDSPHLTFPSKDLRPPRAYEPPILTKQQEHQKQVTLQKDHKKQLQQKEQEKQILQKQLQFQQDHQKQLQLQQQQHVINTQTMVYEHNIHGAVQLCVPTQQTQVTYNKLPPTLINENDYTSEQNSLFFTLQQQNSSNVILAISPHDRPAASSSNSNTRISFNNDPILLVNEAVATTTEVEQTHFQPTTADYTGVPFIKNTHYVGSVGNTHEMYQDSEESVYPADDYILPQDETITDNEPTLGSAIVDQQVNSRICEDPLETLLLPTPEVNKKCTNTATSVIDEEPCRSEELKDEDDLLQMWEGYDGKSVVNDVDWNSFDKFFTSIVVSGNNNEYPLLRHTDYDDFLNEGPLFTSEEQNNLKGMLLRSFPSSNLFLDSKSTNGIQQPPFPPKSNLPKRTDKSCQCGNCMRRKEYLWCKLLLSKLPKEHPAVVKMQLRLRQFKWAEVNRLKNQDDELLKQIEGSIRKRGQSQDPKEDSMLPLKKRLKNKTLSKPVQARTTIPIDTSVPSTSGTNPTSPRTLSTYPAGRMISIAEIVPMESTSKNVSKSLDDSMSPSDIKKLDPTTSPKTYSRKRNLKTKASKKAYVTSNEDCSYPEFPVFEKMVEMQRSAYLAKVKGDKPSSSDMGRVMKSLMDPLSYFQHDNNQSQIAKRYDYAKTKTKSDVEPVEEAQVIASRSLSPIPSTSTASTSAPSTSMPSTSKTPGKKRRSKKSESNDPDYPVKRKYKKKNSGSKQQQQQTTSTATKKEKRKYKKKR